ncbi:MAG: phosphate signaling complex protein PhoU [Anaerolineales bacterium]|nr:phosphate signaling complex protein PhoU [Anaerolineales bacterium]
MARETLDRKIRHLLDELLVLDSMVERTTQDAVEALKRRDLEAARRVHAYDQTINSKRFELENECLTTIATQQPIMARDLRLLASILEIVGELERMGDYAKGIARICIMSGDQPHIKPLIDIPRMCDLTVDMLHRAVGAFVALDTETARRIPEEDDLIDSLYNQVYRELVTIILTNPETIDRANYLMWAAHNLERMADRVTNICERTIYAATGVMSEIDTTDDEMNKLL